MDEGDGGTATRERILAGVDRLFDAQGMKSVGVDAIAAELGISKKTLYRHFPSTDDLVIGHLQGRLRPMPEASTKSPAEQILAGLEWIARCLTTTRDFHGCAFLNAPAEFGSEDSDEASWPSLTRKLGGCGTVTCCASSTSMTQIHWRRSCRCSRMDAAVLIHQDPAMMRPANAAVRTLMKAAGVAISTGEAKSRESGGDKYSVRVLTMVDRDALPHQFATPGQSCDV